MPIERGGEIGTAAVSLSAHFIPSGTRIANAPPVPNRELSRSATARSELSELDWVFEARAALILLELSKTNRGFCHARPLGWPTCSKLQLACSLSRLDGLTMRICAAEHGGFALIGQV
jgi:hypothetical protein